MQLVIAYATTAIVFICIDLLWLGVIAHDYYRAQMAHIIAPQFQIGPAVAFYLMYMGGIVYFAILPALRSGNWTDAILPGAILGLVAYGTYDLTNWAVLKDWPGRLAILDMAWGTLLTAIAATAGAYVALRFR